MAPKAVRAPRGQVKSHTDVLLQGQVPKDGRPGKRAEIRPEAGEPAKDRNHPWVKMYSPPLTRGGPCKGLGLLP